MLFESIKKEILKCTKRKKFGTKKRKEELDYIEYINAHVMSGRVQGYVLNKIKKYVPVIKPFKFANDLYKLELIMDSNFAICIDEKKVKIFREPSNQNILWSDDNEPIFEGYNLSKEDFFHLSIEYDNILTPEQIDILREIMRKRALNKNVSVYATPVMVAGLVPWKW